MFGWYSGVAGYMIIKILVQRWAFGEREQLLKLQIMKFRSTCYRTPPLGLIPKLVCQHFDPKSAAAQLSTEKANGVVLDVNDPGQYCLFALVRALAWAIQIDLLSSMGHFVYQFDNLCISSSCSGRDQEVVCSITSLQTPS